MKVALYILGITVCGLAGLAQAQTVCPGEASECPNGYTCCPLDSQMQTYGCCPLPNAVCCSDYVHCCPEATSCDLMHETCTGDDGVIMEWAIKQPGKKREQNIICPDQNTACPSSSSCCMTWSGWGCCPTQNAVCCSDKEHCCPQGTTCDPAHGRCYDAEGNSEEWLLKTNAQRISVTEDASDTDTSTTVTCPDHKSQCPTSFTCCITMSGAWGCCPMANAVCCSDKVHCCPQATTCDVAQSRCQHANGEFSRWFKKRPAVKVVQDNILCPDQMSQCPQGTTCCQLKNEQWGCCPIQNAVCCDDHEHCCPANSTCDVEHSSCNTVDGISTSWHQKQKARTRNVVCPDGTSECPDATTCCQLQDGQWGCCPLENAVCCDDHEHCCPESTTCDVEQGKCLNGTVVVQQWSRKHPARRLFDQDVQCPDGQSSCPDDSTCCAMQSGEYGCCPMPNAVCCTDQIHCCPQNTQCDLTAQTCTSTRGILTWTALSSAQSERPETRRQNNDDVYHYRQSIDHAVSSDRSNDLMSEIHICSGGSVACPANQKCCSTRDAGYACCTDINGECCHDSDSCCPQGWRCANDGTARCLRPKVASNLFGNTGGDPDITQYL